MNATTSGMVVNDMLLTNTGSITTGGSLSTDVTGPATIVTTTGGGGIVDGSGNGGAGGGVVVVVPTTSNALMAAAMNVPMMVASSQGCPAQVGTGTVEVAKADNGGPVLGGAPPPPSTIPPEITIMSDHDLISYINPNCFDQG